MRKTIVIFGSLSAIIFVLFELNKLSLWRSELAGNAFVILSGLAFIGIGFLINTFLQKKQSRSNRPGPKASGLTKQEHQVLLLMTDGLSNNEIAERLFIAESTVKTHVSRILSKLKARRRTEAIKIGRDLDII